MTQPENHCKEYVPTLRQRIGWKLFPNLLPKHTEPGFVSQDLVRTEVMIELSFLDRCRAFLSGRIHVTVRAWTENVVGKTSTDAHTHVQPWKFLDHR